MRISDILPIKVNDIFNDSGEFRDYLTLKEKKTGKEKRIKINTALRKNLESYVKAKNLTLA